MHENTAEKVLCIEMY